MTQIFISYAREDKTRIKLLVHTLEKQGWSIFWDQHIPAGKTWYSYIGKALNDASCVIVAWSHHSISSDWVREEADEGKQCSILVPILLDSVVPPMGFRSIQAVDLSNWPSEHASPQFEQLLNGISEILKISLTPTIGLIQSEIDKSHQPGQYKKLFRKPVWIGVGSIVIGATLGILYLLPFHFFISSKPEDTFQTYTPKATPEDYYHIGNEFGSIGPGSRGPAVQLIQQDLKEEGYFAGTPSGDYDQETQKAIVNFQKENGIMADGILGFATARKILELRNKDARPR